MDIVYIVKRKQRARVVVQGKRSGQPVDPLPLPTYCFKAVDTITGDYVGEYEDEASAQELCNKLNAQLPQNQNK